MNLDILTNEYNHVTATKNENKNSSSPLQISSCLFLVNPFPLPKPCIVLDLIVLPSQNVINHHML